jgi:DNA-binding Lrp family transcriptional regulator
VFELDETDRRILQALRVNARVTNSDLAEMVGLSPSACLRRTRLLEERRVIRGYTTILSEDQDEGLVAFVQITLEKQTDEQMRRFEAAVRDHAEIRDCYLMAGSADYMVRVAAADMAAYEWVHKNMLSRLPGVARIQSSLAIRNVLATRRKG